MCHQGTGTSPVAGMRPDPLFACFAGGVAVATRFTGLLFLFAQPLRQGYVGQFEFAIRYRNSKRVAELLADACRECGTVEVEDEDVVVNDELQVVRTPGLEPDWPPKPLILTRNHL